MTAIVTGKRVRPQQPLGPIRQGSESLEVWSDLYKPTWTRLRTIIRRGGRHGKIVCTPESLSCLLRRPALLGYDAMDWLTRWGRRVLAEGPGSRSAEDRLKRRCGVQDSLSLSPAGSRSADRAK